MIGRSMSRFPLSILALCALAAPAWGQAGPMEVQQLVWQCQAAAQDRGLTGRASETFVNRCLAAGGGGPSADGPMRPQRRDPNPTGATPSWRVKVPTSGQVTMTITSVDRAFSWEFDCTRIGQPLGSFVFLSLFTYPPGVSVYGYTRAIEIDGIQVPIEVGGSEGGVVGGADGSVTLTDGVAFNIATVAPRTRQMLAEGSILRIPVRARGGSRRDAVFNLAGGRGPFSEFERGCRSLR